MYVKRDLNRHIQFTDEMNKFTDCFQFVHIFRVNLEDEISLCTTITLVFILSFSY